MSIKIGFNFLKMYEVGGAEYARQEAWDIMQASSAINFVASMAMNEVDEPDDIQSLANIIRSLMEFINGELQEMVSAAKEGVSSKSAEIENNFVGKVTVPAEVKQHDLDLSYIKSLNVEVPDNRLAVKYVGKNTIAHPVFIWGDAKKTDLEIDFFNRQSDFWDEQLKDFVRPLTWEHGQDEKFAKLDENPVIGKTVKFYDDDLARWAESVIETDKKYRKYIDQFIEEKRLGYSSDSAPQYVIREKQGKAYWLKMWPWFGGALTASPCEPRMKVYTPEFLKSLGIALPDMSPQTWEADMARFKYLKTKYL